MDMEMWKKRHAGVKEASKYYMVDGAWKEATNQKKTNQAGSPLPRSTILGLGF